MDDEIRLFKRIRTQILTEANLISQLQFPALVPQRAVGSRKLQNLHIHELFELRLLFRLRETEENNFSEFQQLCLTPPEVPHLSLLSNELKRHITLRVGAAEVYYMRGLDLSKTFDPSRVVPPPGISLSGLIHALEETGYGRIADPDYIRLLLAMLFSLMISCWEENGESSSLDQADRIAAFMRANYFKTDLSIREIAEKHNLSPNYIQTLFRKRWGCSPLHYLNEVRLKNARLLLQKHRYQVKEVAAMCGWEYTHYFCKKYREYFGHLPSDE